LSKLAEGVGESVANRDRPILLYEGEKLGEEVRRQMLLGPASDAAFEPPLTKRSGGARGRGDPDRPLVEGMTG